MAELIRRMEWTQTSLGPLEKWPQSLRTTVSLCLASNFPINIIRGSQHDQIYNDGYRVICGEAHPRSLGVDYSITWNSAWPAVGELFARALQGETTYIENRRMFLARNGYLEETFFTFSLSPIRDESGGIGGLFHPVGETTVTMLSERRTRASRDLSASLAVATSEADLAHRTVEVLSQFEFDLPFALLYAFAPGEKAYRLAAYCGAAPNLSLIPSSIESGATSPWPFAEPLKSSHIVEVGGLSQLLLNQPWGPYEGPPDRAFIVPIGVPGADRPPALIVAGASPRLPLNDTYRGCYEFLRMTVAGALAAVCPAKTNVAVLRL